MDQESESYLCRKKVASSFQRHFSSWKHRNFKIDQNKCLLIVSNKNGRLSAVFDLLLSTIRSHDDYSPTLNNANKESYYLSIAHEDIEILIKFNTLISLYQIEEKLRSVANQGIANRCHKKLTSLNVLRKFLSSQVSIPLYWLIV